MDQLDLQETPIYLVCPLFTEYSRKISVTFSIYDFHINHHWFHLYWLNKSHFILTKQSLSFFTKKIITKVPPWQIFEYEHFHGKRKNEPENPFQTMISQISLFKPKNHLNNLSKILSKNLSNFFQKICPLNLFKNL